MWDAASDIRYDLIVTETKLRSSVSSCLSSLFGQIVNGLEVRTDFSTNNKRYEFKAGCNGSYRFYACRVLYRIIFREKVGNIRNKEEWTILRPNNK